MNASSLDLTAHAVLLNQEWSFGLIDLFLLGMYNRIPSKIMFETISAAESFYLKNIISNWINQKIHLVHANLLWRKAKIYVSVLGLKHS